MNTNELMDYIASSRYMGFVMEDAHDMIDNLLCSRPEYESILSDKGKEDLVDIYRSRVIPIYSSVMMRRVIRHTGLSSLSKHNWKTKIDDAYDEIMNKLSNRPKEFLQTDYPLIESWEKIIGQNTYDSLKEMLDRILKDKDEVSKIFFKGRKIRCIESVDGMKGDIHRKGRSVAKIVTNAGVFYYKPHDCSIDMAFGELVKKLFSDTTVAPKCISRDGYGYVAELVSKPLKKEADLDKFYLNFGRMLALFHAVGSTDMHIENIISCGDKPVVVDIETIISPTIKSTGSFGGKTITSRMPLEMDGMNNVYKTGMLPVFVNKVGVFSPLYKNIRNDNKHLPYVGEEHFDITGHEDTFLRGFHEGYNRVAKNKDSIRSIFYAYPNSTIRYVPKNTAFYTTIRDMLFMSTALESKEGQAEVFKKLEVPYKAMRQDVNKYIINHEVKCLLEGDVPYFCVALSGRNLAGLTSDQTIESGFMSESALERMDRKLDMLSDMDEEYETRIIKNALTRVVATKEQEAPFKLEEEHAADDNDDGQGKIYNLTSDSWAIKEELARNLLDDAIPYTDGLVIWNHVPMHFMRWRSCGVSTEWGQVSRFAAEVAGPDSKLPEDLISELKVMVGKCMTGLNLKISLWDKEDPEVLGRILSSNIFRGVGGLLIDINQMTDADFDGAEAMLLRLLNLISKKKLHLMKDEYPSDAAGLMMALCHINLYNISSEAVRQATVPLIEESLNHMLVYYRDDESWNIRDKAFMAAAYAMAHKVTQDYEALVRAEKLIKEVRAGWNNTSLGWDEKSTYIHWAAPAEAGFMQTGNMILMAGFHLPVGDAKDVAVEIAKMVADRLYARDALWHLDTLEYGNSLAVELLRTAAVVLDEPKYKVKADKFLKAMIRRYRGKGCFTNMPNGLKSFFDFYYMGGSLSWGRF